MKDWNAKVNQLNDTIDVLEEQDIERFEEESKSVPLISNIINKIKSITRKTTDLSVNEIHEVIDDDIMEWENNLSSTANNFIMLGVLFTVISLFSSVPNKTSIEEIRVFLDSFKFAFWTTIIGIVASLIVKYIERLIGKKRESFRYNLVLLVKTILVPRYSIPEVNEKNLGELVLSISKAANSVQASSDALEGLAKKTQAGTENIEKAVSGFTVISEKIIQKEDSLNKSLGNLNNYLIQIQKNLDESIQPLSREILEQLSQNAVRNENNLNEIAELRTSQIEMNEKINSSLKLIASSHKQLGDFFGKDFKNIFKKSLDELNNNYQEELNSISRNLKEFSDDFLQKMNDDSKLDLLHEKTDRFIVEFLDMNKIIKDIQEPLNEMKKDLGNIQEGSKQHNESIDNTRGSIDEINQNIKTIHDGVYRMQELNENKDSEEIKGTVNELRINVESIIKSIEMIKEDISTVVENINLLDSDKNSGFVSGIRKVFGGGSFKK